ncbi:hypothetical protein [Endozoicomonas arenosclerae]|uniref:hypothetical protein n=1 Tax=Endozoicomonas arenosclerae TaxID=1633495 RepID=UPI000B0D6D47|nr:hypothetical protein [Endozoicomonas arenosclerae]
MSIGGPDKPVSSDSAGSKQVVPQAAKGKKKKGGQNKGRTVIHAEGSSIADPVAESRQSSRPSGSHSSDQKRRITGKRLTDSQASDVSGLLKIANKELEAFAKQFEAQFKKVALKCDASGYSLETHDWLFQLENLQALLVKRNRLLEKVYKDTRQHSSEIKAFEQKVRSIHNSSKGSTEESPLQDIVAGKGVHEMAEKGYWKQRAFINLIANHSERLQTEIVKAITGDVLLPHIGTPLCTARYTDWITAGLKCMQAYDESIQCLKHLKKPSEVDHARERYEKIGQVTLLNLEHATGHFLEINAPEQLRQILSAVPSVLALWLEAFDPDNLVEGRAPQQLEIVLPIIASVILGHPEHALRLLPSYLTHLKTGHFDPSGASSLLRHLSKAMEVLIRSSQHRKGSPEYYHEIKTMEETCSLLLTQLKLHTDWVGEQDPEEYARKTLPAYLKCYSQLREMELAVAQTQTSASLAARALEKEIDDEKAAALTRRMKRSNQGKSGQDGSSSKQSSSGVSSSTDKSSTGGNTSASSSQVEVTTKPTEEFHPAIAKAIKMMSSAAPLEAIAKTIAAALQAKTLSTWDRTNLRYCYADIIVSRLDRTVEKLEDHDATLEQFEACLKGDQLPGISLDIRFRKAISQYQQDIRLLAFNLMRLKLEYEYIYDVCVNDEDVQDKELLAELISLHDKIALLLHRAEKIIANCDRLEGLFAGRGRVLRLHGKTGSANPENKRLLMEAVAQVSNQKAQLGMQYQSMQKSLKAHRFSEPAVPDSLPENPVPQCQPEAQERAQARPSSSIEPKAVGEASASSATSEVTVTQLPVASLMPEKLCDALLWGLSQSGENWVMGINGLVIEEKVKQKKEKAGKKSSAEKKTEEALTPEVLQACFYNYIRQSQETDKERDGQEMPDQPSLKKALQRAKAKSMFIAGDYQDDLSLLADALGVPILMTSSSENVLFKPGLQKPEKQKLDVEAKVEGGVTLYLEEGRWYSSIDHYWSLHD